MNKPYVLNRKVYKDIKKMDHSQMNTFCRNLYTNGYKDGMKAAEGLSVEEVKEVVMSIKGIGEKRAELIINALQEKMETRDADKETVKGA